MKVLYLSIVLVVLIGITSARNTYEDNILIETETNRAFDNHIECLTDEVYRWKKATRYNTTTSQVAADCTEGSLCDTYDFRKDFIIQPLVLQLQFHVVCLQQGPNGNIQCPNDVDQSALEAAVDLLNDFTAPASISFTAVYNFHYVQDDECIAPYSSTSNQWYYDIEKVKLKYAITPETNLNVFITCQTSGADGTLYGIATFPWDAEALTFSGGLWLNSNTLTAAETAANNPVLAHELGHCLGLWHTFHGVSEVPACTACFENWHETDLVAEEVGDLAGDTQATPKNYDCVDPPARDNDCNDHSYDNTDYTNIMGYSRYPDNCRNVFSNAQISRMHCWLCHELPSLVVSGCE